MNPRKKPEARPRPGFALVISLSLMVLLTVIAIGLLTLSSITLRASGQGDAMAAARSNARMALSLAIGQLQKHAGPDQRVTARADILDENIANPRLTGVWDSWEIKATSPPSPGDFGKEAKNAKFRSWLASGPEPAAITGTEFASSELPAPVTLWGDGSLGKDVADTSRVRAARIPLSASPGAVAWAVLDEGVKARIDTTHDSTADSAGAKTAQLGSGERPAVEFIDGLEALERGFFEQDAPESATMRKGITASNYSLAAGSLAPGVRDSLRPLVHDVTTHSAGLFTDTARGGLRTDFHLLANAATLPAGYAGQGIYTSRLGLKPSDAPSDPVWDSLQQFSRLYRDKISNVGGVPVLKVQAPARWQAAQATSGGAPVTTVNRKPPPGVVLMPTIAKVQMVFSLIGRDIYSYPAFGPGQTPPLVPDSAANMHGPQDGHFRGTKYDYDLHLLYTPVVTLHNPYNVALEFRNLRVEFLHVPFSMQVFRNGIPQSRGMVPLETMYADNAPGNAKIFGMNLKTKSGGRPGSPTFRLLPGEVKLFSPYIDPDRTYQQDLRDRKFWDIYVGTGITNNIDAMPGWRGDGIGFDCDWLAGNQRMTGAKEDGQWASCLGLARDDRIHVEFAPLSTADSRNKFTIRMMAALGNNSTPTVVNAIEMDYESLTGLQDFTLGRGKTLRFPSTGTVLGMDMVDHSTRKVKDIVSVKPFAMLSVQAKTTSGGRDVSNKDGRLATKPWCFAHGNIAASSQKVVSEHSANHSHEFDLQLLELGRGTVDTVPIDPQDRGNFITGHTTLYGSKFGSLYDIPLAPVQTLASLNGANPGGSSGFLPRFAQPIGNSWAHPLMSPNRIVEPAANGARLDHSFLLNLALYDSYYFSGLADQSGAFGSGTSTAALAAAFAAGQPLDDPRIDLHLPDGRPASELAGLLNEPTAHEGIAAWQMMRGAFNVNSTSVPAWKAMLASIHDPQAILNLVAPGGTSTRIENLKPVEAGEARVSRFRLPASASASDGADPGLAYWLGPRELSGAELELLAEKIVEQVRSRGPFLSMSEFVNRRLGSDEAAQRGALQQAIDTSGLNGAAAAAANAGFEIPAAQVAGYKYANPAAGAGSSYQGAPGYLTQADLLNVLGNAATARSDTFTVRGYGEARDAKGKILASATCEAVVQRMPEWLDSADVARTAPAALGSQANKTFGRRFNLISFRWLGPKEI
jgi:hypothetical protein